jgi:hypothetical protein
MNKKPTPKQAAHFSVLHFAAPNDIGGNPRRLYVVYNSGSVVGHVDEGYEGIGSLLSTIWGAEVGKVLQRVTSARVYISASEYQRLRGETANLYSRTNG